VGVALYDQLASTYHPRKFALYVVVHPEHQGQRIGSALYDCVTSALAPLDPISLLVREVREDQFRAIAFLKRRGFRETLRAWESRLDVAAFDPSRFATITDVARKGIEIKTFGELEPDPQRAHKLYGLLSDTEADVPIVEPRTRLDYDHFVRNMLSAPQLNPDSFFVAVSGFGGDYVGMSILWRSFGSDNLQSGMTGVRQAYRRRGVALALKLRAISWARANGYVAINTSNATSNAPILTLNERLGFVRQKAAVDFLKVLRGEAT
jgi:ribosomal protein S18 acetylase RimI-like enzyme